MREEALEAPGGTPPDKRLTTAWRVRRRYRLAQWLLAAAGLAAGAALVAASVAALPDPHGALGPRFLAQAAAIVVAAVAVPWLVVDGLWGRARRRNLWEWQ